LESKEEWHFPSYASVAGTRFCARQPLRCRFAHRFLQHIGMNIKHYQSDRNAGELMVGDWFVVDCDDRLCTFGFWFIFQWESEAPRSILLVSKHFRHYRNAKTRHKRVFDR
jgi:hypothetical protein